MCHVSRVTRHVSCVTCHLSPVTCHMSHFFLYPPKNWTKWWSQSVEDLLSTGPTPSSFNRAGVAEGVLQTLLMLINYLGECLSLFLQLFPNQKSQEPENVHPQHASHVRVSHAICQTSGVHKKIDKEVELVGGGSVINRAYPVQFLCVSPHACIPTSPKMLSLNLKAIRILLNNYYENSNKLQSTISMSICYISKST